MANLSSTDHVYDKAGPSYDSDILSEVHDHDHYQDAVFEHHKEHEMHDDVQPNYVVDSHAIYTSDSNMIPYEQMKDVFEDLRSRGDPNCVDRFTEIHDAHTIVEARCLELEAELSNVTLIKALPSIHNSHNVVRTVKQVWKPKQVRQVWKPICKCLLVLVIMETRLVYSLRRIVPLIGSMQQSVYVVQSSLSRILASGCLKKHIHREIVRLLRNFANHYKLHGKGSRGSNLYTISVKDMMKSFPIRLLSKASKNKSWLWHRCLNHLNFGTINDLVKKDLVRVLPRLKFEKHHLCSACQLEKSKKHTHTPKAKNTNLEVLNTLHMDLCGPMRVQTINGKKYVLVIVDDYSRFTWVKFLRSKDETPEAVIKFLKQIQIGLNKTIRYIHTDNGTKFVNQVLTEYYERVGIFHQKSVPRTLQQHGVVERQNCTLVEAARTMLIFSKALMFLWAEAVATTYYTQNRSLIHTRHNKTPYELVHDKKLDLTFF
ncbi:retrovirus-related pol polyprotein from transposon TNT 1-94 [Tanacetum coccineum]